MIYNYYKYIIIYNKIQDKILFINFMCHTLHNIFKNVKYKSKYISGHTHISIH